MTLFWNLKLGRLVTDVGGEVERSAINFKRGDAAEIEILFFRGNVVQVMPTTMEIRFAVKPTNSFSSPPLVFQNAFTRQDWTNPATQEVVVGGRWLADISTNTEQINDYFADEGEPDSVELRGEITYRADDDRGWNSSQTFSVGIDNDLIKGDEGTPTNAEEPTNYITTTGAEARYLRYDASQTLTGGQKTQARSNIGALEGTGLGVSTSEQTLTSEQKAQVLTNLGLASTSQVAVYAAGSHSWTNPSPSTAKLVRIIMVGAGGGGGSGRKGLASGTVGGGGGGAAGSIVEISATTAQLGSTVTVTVGTAGAGGAASATDDTTGAAGTAGGDTSIYFTKSGNTFEYLAKGGNSGSGGTGSAGGTAGAGRTNSQLIGSNLSNSLAGGAGGIVAGSNAPAASTITGTGGGGGGGLNTDVTYAGGNGGAAGNSLIGQITGAAGAINDTVNGQAGVSWLMAGLGGGGGYAGGTDGTGTNGGAGGTYGGGGGGGGAAGNGSGSSGAGGAGGAGICIIAVF
jgi:hypothetical protein